MEFVELKKHLKAQKPHACYVCYGDDEFLVERAVSLVTSLASEPKPFNCVDREFDRGRDLTDELMQLPLTGDFRVVVSRGKTDPSVVSEYLKNPNPASVLVLPIYVPHDSWGRASAPAFEVGAEKVDCNRLAVKHIAPLVRAFTGRTNSEISDDNIRLLCDRCGGYMTRINTEAQKLAVLRAGGEITADDINGNVKADTEFVVFELCECILAGNTARALSVVDGMAKSNDLVAAFTLIYNRFRKIFAAAVDPDGLSGLGVKPTQVGKLKSESAKFSKARLKSIIDMLESTDYSYKTGASTVYDALVGFVAQAAYGNRK